MESFKTEYIDLMISKAPDLFVALLVIFVFWIIAKILNAAILKILDKHTTSTIPKVIASIMKKIIIVIGFITSLGTLGVDVSGIIAGLGISGVALSLALKDILSNFVSGI